MKREFTSRCAACIRAMMKRISLYLAVIVSIPLKIAVYFGLLLSVIASPVNAEPSSSALLIAMVRTYSSGDIYVSMKSAAFCSTDTFRIPASHAGRKEMMATLLIAQAMDRPVLLEVVNSTGCAGWGTSLQSIYLYTP